MTGAFASSTFDTFATGDAVLLDLPALGIEPWGLLLLIVCAAGAGWIDAVSGGGGLLQLPALLLLAPQASGAQVLGTNKLGSIIGTSAAATTYLRRTRPDVRIAIPMATAAFVGSAIGALLASRIPTSAFRPVVVILLLGAWTWTLLRPALGRADEPYPASHRRRTITAIAGGFFIGVYDGSFGPGTGSFLLILLVAGIGLSFLHASATAKIVNLGTNLAAVIVFSATGSIVWALGLAMGLGNLVGAVIGARTAIARGSGFVRIVFLVVAGVLILRLGWDLVPRG